jgi:hypothetical protein
MSIAVPTCSHCDATLKLKQPPVTGQKYRCKKCGGVIRVPAKKAPANGRSTAAASKPKKSKTPDRKKRKKAAMSGLFIGLSVGGGVLLILLGFGAIGGYLWWNRSQPAETPLAQNKDKEKKDGKKDKIEDKPPPDKKEEKKDKKEDKQDTVKKPGKKRFQDINIVDAGPSILRLIDDPKWKADPDLKQVLPGRWLAKGGFCTYSFSADGALRRFEGNLKDLIEGGTFQVISAERLEFTLALEGKKGKQTNSSYVILVGNLDEEIAVFAKSASGKPNDYYFQRQIYRLRDDGTGLGRTVVIDELVKKLDAKDIQERRAGLFGLLGIGPDAWPAVPALTSHIQRKTLNESAPMAIRIIGRAGPKATNAVTILQECIRSEYFSIDAVMALGEIGPAAKAALPDIRRHLPQDYAVNAIRKIEGK